jgi:L-fuconolactonase
MKIDAEVCFWKYDKLKSNSFIRNNKLLNQNYLTEQLTHNLARNGIGGCIAVVRENEEVESRFLEELSSTHTEIKGVVGWTDLNNIKSTDRINDLHQYASLKGFRIEMVEDPVPSQHVMELLNEYQYSLDITLRAGADMAVWEKFLHTYPDQQFILQHGGNPDTHGTPDKAWETSIRGLAKNQNLSCKISGLLTGGVDLKSWKPSDFYPFLDILFESFGPERLMFASDWPFILLAGIYVQWKSLLEKFTEKFSAEDRDKFFGENAMRIYRL